LRFAHLTFQEFFAAIELNDSSSSTWLLDHFKKDPRRWREVCLLYCGTSSRSNAFVFALIDYDLITAANCVADSENVSVELARNIIDRLVARLRAAKEHELSNEIIAINDKRGAPIDVAVDSAHRELESLLQALSLLAADQRRFWSNLAFDSLRKFFHEAAVDFHKYAAIAALANVTSEVAARELVGALEKPETKDVAKRALAQLGVVGLPALKQVVRSTEEGDLIQVCLELCAQIPYPEVIDIIVPFLDSDIPIIRATAAWALAVLIQDPSIANSLDLLKPGELYTPSKNDNSQHAELNKWVWPFQSEDSTGMSHLMAAVVSCLSPNFVQDLATKEGANARIDIRIAIPISIQLFKAQPPGELDSRFKRTVSTLLTGDEMAWELPAHWLKDRNAVTVYETRSWSGSVPLSEVFNHDVEFLKESWKNILEKKTAEPSDSIRKMAQILNAIYLFLAILITRPSSFLSLLFLLTALTILTRFWASRLDQDPLVILLSVPAGGTGYIRDLTSRNWTSLQHLTVLFACLLFILAWTAYVGLLGGSFLGQPWSVLAAMTYVITTNTLFGSDLGKGPGQSNPWLPFLQSDVPQRVQSVYGHNKASRNPAASTILDERTIPVPFRHPPRRSRGIEIFAMAAVAVSLLTFLSLVSYRVSDLLFVAADRPSVHNWVGPIGANVSHTLFRAIGLAAFLVPLLLLGLAGWSWVRRTRIGFSLQSLMAAVGLILASASLLTFSGLNTPFQWRFPIGGIAGALVGTALTTRFPQPIAFALAFLGLLACLGWLINVTWLRIDYLLRSILRKTSR
jgi:hypothetical protein